MAADGGPAAGRAATTGLATGAATAAAAGASAAAGSPSRAATSEADRAGKPLRPRRACSAAIVDLLHFLPSATHLATSALMGPLGAGAAATGTADEAGAEGGAAAAGGALSSTGSPNSADISALFSAGKPLRPRRACSAAMVDLLHFLPSATHLATSSLIPPAGEVAAGVDAEGAGAGAGDAATGVLAAVGGGAAPPTSHGIG